MRDRDVHTPSVVRGLVVLGLVVLGLVVRGEHQQDWPVCSGRTSTPEGRYQIHELLRQYAIKMLALAPAAREAASNAHCAFYCALLHSQESKLKTAHRTATLATLWAELQNLRAAWNWAILHAKTEQLDQAMDSLAALYQWRGRYWEGEEAFRMLALQMASEIGAFTPLLFAIPCVAVLEAKHGSGQRAGALYALAARFSFVADSRWFQDVYERSIPDAVHDWRLERTVAAHEQENAQALWAAARMILAET